MLQTLLLVGNKWNTSHAEQYVQFRGISPMREESWRRPRPASATWPDPAHGPLRMKLRAMIIRFEGVVFPTCEAFRLATNEVLAEAGFDHVIGPEEFALQFGHYICKERFFDYAAQFLLRRRRSDDLSTLLEMTYRRIIVTAEQALAANPPTVREGVLDLISAGREAGIKFAVVTSINVDTANPLVSAPLAGVPVFAPARMKNQWTGTALQRSADALGCALEGLDLPPHGCLALQSSSYGLAAAESAGVPAVAIIGQSALNGGLYGARAVADNLFDLVAEKSPSPDQNSGEILLKRLRALHASEGNFIGSHRSNAMQVHHILKDKGPAIKSVNPTDSVQTVAKRLSDEKVGAMVVISPLGTLEGIVSERDLVRGIATEGCDLLGMPVSSIMTRAVITCSPADSLYGVAKVMTNRRIRHLPVSELGKLVGLISIGDVLSRRLEEVQLEADVLRDYTIALK